jgi:quinol monooxygenase YgiN
MYAISGVMDVKPEHLVAFTEATIQAARAAVADEPGVFQFHILADADVPTRFYYYEVFRDEAATAAHGETEHYKTWRATVADMLDGETRRIANMRTVFPSDHGLEKQKAGLLDW